MFLTFHTRTVPVFLRLFVFPMRTQLVQIQSPSQAHTVNKALMQITKKFSFVLKFKQDFYVNLPWKGFSWEACLDQENVEEMTWLLMKHAFTWNHSMAIWSPSNFKILPQSQTQDLQCQFVSSFILLSNFSINRAAGKCLRPLCFVKVNPQSCVQYRRHSIIILS